MPVNAFERLKSYAEDILHDRKKLLRILLIILILMLAFVMRIHENSKADITIDSTSPESAGSREICVDVSGGVVNPGVYTVGDRTRLFEVIELAGGLLSNADTDSINRAEYVEDGEKIIIPVRPLTVQENAAASDDPAVEGTDSDASNSGQYGSDQEISGAAEPEADAGTAALYSGGSLVNINYASKEELMTLKGIGESKAEKIIEYRSSRKFRKKEDIKSVNGIGDAIYNKIKDSITV